MIRVPFIYTLNNLLDNVKIFHVCIFQALGDPAFGVPWALRKP